MNWIEHSLQEQRNCQKRLKPFSMYPAAQLYFFVSLTGDDTKESHEGLVFILTARISTI